MLTWIQLMDTNTVLTHFRNKLASKLLEDRFAKTVLELPSYYQNTIVFKESVNIWSIGITERKYFRPCKREVSEKLMTNRTEGV